MKMKTTNQIRRHVSLRQWSAIVAILGTGLAMGSWAGPSSDTINSLTRESQSYQKNKLKAAGHLCPETKAFSDAYAGQGGRVSIVTPGTDCCAENGVKSPSAGVNRAFLSSPRAREEFPWLTRGTTGLAVRVENSEAAVAKRISNRALASSPRFLEEHPELLRGEGKLVFTTPSVVPAEVMKNAALVASPRTREEFPAILRTPSVVLESASKVQIAPLK